MIAAIINDQNLADFGVSVASVSGVLDGYEVSYPTTKVPGRAGVVRLSRLPEVEPREIQIRGAIEAASVAALDAALGTFKAWLARDLTIRSGYDLSKAYRGTCTRCVVTAPDPQFLVPGAFLTLTFTCDDPRAYAIEATVIGLTAARTPCPLGTAASEPVIRIMGPATDPMLIYRDANGTVRTYQRFTVTLGWTEYLDISAPALTILRWTDGVAANGIGTLHETDPGDFLTLDPADGDPSASAWPTVEVTAGTGEIIYARSYL